MCTIHDHTEYKKQFKFCPYCGASLEQNNGPIPGARFFPTYDEPPTSPSTLRNGIIFNSQSYYVDKSRRPKTMFDYACDNIKVSDIPYIMHVYNIITSAQDDGFIGDLFTVRTVNAATNEHFYNFEKLRNLGVLYVVGYAVYGNSNDPRDGVFVYSLVPNHAEVIESMCTEKLRSLDIQKNKILDKLRYMDDNILAAEDAFDGFIWPRQQPRHMR